VDSHVLNTAAPGIHVAVLPQGTEQVIEQWRLYLVSSVSNAR